MEKHDKKGKEQKETIQSNYDGHDRHQDNELKNIQEQTRGIREEIKEIKAEGKQDEWKTENNMNDIVKGQKRIIPANELRKEEHGNMDKIDKISIPNLNLMSVVANHTIAALQTETNNTPLRAGPLSSFSFGKVDTSIDGEFGITPYKILNTIPQLFKFKAQFNESQQVNLPDYLTMKFSSEQVNETIAKSIQLFNISTMTVRTEINDELGINPNSLEDGSIKLSTLIPAARQNPQTSVNFIENRIFSVLKAFNGLDNILIAIPRKIVVLDSARGGPVAESIVKMPFYENLHPHPYYSVFSNLPDWARAHFNEAFTTNPLQVGDLAVESYAGKKLAQTTKTILDQYTAEVLRLNFQKLRNHTLTHNVLQEKIRASLFRYDRLEVISLCDVEDFSLLYNYTQDEQNLYMFRLLTDKSTQLKVVNFLHDELVKTNRLTTTPIDDIWRGLIAGDMIAYQFNQSWLASINIGHSQTPYEMLIYETFSDFFTFNLSFGPIPNSIEAVTEVLNIYVFIMLYPRISQRIIHHLGYRLTSLYATMYPQIFNHFRQEFGDVRTNFGKDKFNAYDYKISRTESQQGYVYSIFVPLSRNRVSDRGGMGVAQSMLSKFISLLNSLRTLIIPTTEQYSLDRKRIAKYPYMYDNYTAYASWKPIQYTDYYNNQMTELGTKLKTLIGYNNDFKDLYYQQNPASSQIPRQFNAYYTAWSNNLTNILSTAGGVYQLTCAMIQETLFNSPFYVGSQYNPDQKYFWYVPKDIGIGPLVSASMNALVIPTHIQVNNFKVNIAMNLAISAEGEYLRNVIAPYEGESQVQEPARRIREDITSLDAVACFKMANSIISEARKFGFAMQVTQWLTTPNDTENPFSDLVDEIAKYMKMASWVPLVKKIFTLFNLNYDEMFIRSMGGSEFILDGRFLDRTLVLVNPTTSMAASEQPLNSKFNQKFTYMVPSDIDKIEVLTRPLLSLDSKIIYIHRDWYFGKLVVNEMGPTQYDLKTTNWTDETTFNRHFKFSRISYKNGQAAQIEYKSDIDGRHKSMILPYTANNVPVLLITMDYANELALTYLRVLAKAISQGKIILRMKKMKMRVWIEDMPSRTLDYSEPNLTEDEIYDIISLPAGCIIEWKFKTTNYASNFESQAFVCPGYIQWFATPTPADRNIFTSTITNAITRPEQTVLPTADEMGYGPDQEGKLFPNNVEKIKSNIINWNNSIPTVSPKLLNSVDLRIIPYIPQYLGSS